VAVEAVEAVVMERAMVVQAVAEMVRVAAAVLVIHHLLHHLKVIMVVLALMWVV
jgi:hypothetical protein